MLILKKIFFNPIIWLYNMFNYFCHLELNIHTKEEYEEYDFSKDKKYY